MKDGEIVQIGSAEEIISRPSNDYVKAFVEDMDRAAVLTAGTIMQPAKEIAFTGDGPRTILRKMKRNGLSGIFMIDSKRDLKGYILADELAENLKKHQKEDDVPFDKSLLREASKVDQDEALSDVINAYHDSEYGPIAVVDDKNRLRGVIVRGAIIAALSQDPEAIDEGKINTGSPESLGTDNTGEQDNKS